MTEFHYVVIGRTGITLNETSAANSNQFKFRATLWMTPEVQVFIFFFHPTGDVVYDTLTIGFKNQLTNTVKTLFERNNSVYLKLF